MNNDDKNTMKSHRTIIISVSRTMGLYKGKSYRGDQLWRLNSEDVYQSKDLELVMNFTDSVDVTLGFSSPEERIVYEWIIKYLNSIHCVKLCHVNTIGSHLLFQGDCVLKRLDYCD